MAEAAICLLSHPGAGYQTSEGLWGHLGRPTIWIPRQKLPGTVAGAFGPHVGVGKDAPRAEREGSQMYVVYPTQQLLPWGPWGSLSLAVYLQVFHGPDRESRGGGSLVSQVVGPVTMVGLLLTLCLSESAVPSLGYGWLLV